jgi:hypothetical protein
VIACECGYAGRQDLTAELSKAAGFLSSLYTACLNSAITRSIITLRVCSANCCAQFKSRMYPANAGGPAQVCEVTARKAHPIDARERHAGSSIG